MDDRSERFGDWVLFGPGANVQIEGTLSLTLPAGNVVQVRRRLVKFEPWRGPIPEIPRIWTSKGFVYVRGGPLLAELAILGLLEKDGWSGVWVNNFSTNFLKGLPGLSEPSTVPGQPLAVFEKIKRRNGRRRGCWDVFAWRAGEVLFAEAKRMDKDKIQKSQIEWLDAALNVGIPLEAFLVVEWDFM